MTITYNLLLEADFTALEATGESWRNLYQVLDDQAAILVELKSKDDAPFGIDNWDGQSGEAARERVRDVVLALDERSAAARRVSVAIADAAEEFKGAQADLNDVISEIGSERVALTDTGSVIPDTSTGTDNIYYAEGIQSRITAALERATDANEVLKAAVGMWAETFSESERLALAHDAEDEAGELQELIDSGASPEAINEWWNNLSETEQLGILEGNPALIAGVDGIPTDTRDAANRDLLDTAINRFSPSLDSDIAELEAQLAEMEANGEQYDYNEGNLGIPHQSAEYAELATQLAELQEQRDERDALANLQEAVSGSAPTGQDHYLLGFDTKDDGGAIVSIGNPDTATNTGIFVPGTFSALDNFGGNGGALERATAMASDAQDYGVPGEETAVIAWLDYDSPQSASPLEAFKGDTWDLSKLAPEAGDGAAAEEGAQTLNHFINGLDATHEGEPSNTTIAGHSYGGLLVGEAAQDPNTGADQVIGVAAPGFGVDRASELAVGEDNVWATMAEGDAIAFPAGESMIHGNDPTGENFGGNVFNSTASGADGGEIHGGYWDEGNAARKDMALILTGQSEFIKPPGE
ncbi:alpha/beta hydrolase [Glycomyces niveus]|uniref:DUF1023 domain-containing protein n=1 Tax=Glycomyces niveus TaxID=2820287 RepID=A0ABS3U5W0_9ACTN|nr:alpha/beta hydrolase [Glycomyces sp. NEAU-S30]MBO3733128.1 hypothetical protein [Glycomyces sp. NEAU-S30]